MNCVFVTNDKTIIALPVDLPDPKNLSAWLCTLEATYAQLTDVHLLTWTEVL